MIAAASISMDDLLLTLPHRVAPMLDETVDSYTRRLAETNRQHYWDLRRYIAGSGKEPLPTPPDRLAAISGIPLPILRQAMLELCTDDDLRTMNVAGRPRPGFQARPGCLRCTKGRTATFWTRQEDALVCLRHRCLTGPEIWDLAQVPDILQANRRHRRLIRHHGRHAVWRAFHAASVIVTEWEGDGRTFIGDSRDRLLTFWRDKSKRVNIDHPTSIAATYPEVIGSALAYADEVGSEFELEFVDADGAERHKALSQCWHVRFETSRPARSFPAYKGQGNFPGEWWFATTGEHVGYESWLERDNVMVLDFDPRVVGLSSQPFWLHWPVEDGWRRHAPDYFARFEDGSAAVVDVRADDKIKPEDAEAFAATERACREVGWGFRRVGELDPVFGRNLRWLSRYAHPRFAGRPWVIARLSDVFAEPTPLFAGAAQVGDTLEVLPVVYHLMWRHSLAADLASAPLGPSMLVGPGAR